VSLTSVFFDIDGTLVDSNDAHARAWVDTFAERGMRVAFDRVRPLIGMGGDKLLCALDLGIEIDGDAGAALSTRRKAIFLERYIGGVRAFPGARELVATMKDAGLCCIVTSSASSDELTPLLAIAGAAELFDHAIRPDEVDATKPDPDVVLAALAWSQTDAARALMIGDTGYDIDAAHRSGVRCIALRCGGSSSDDLAQADAQFDDPAALVDTLKRISLDALLRPRTLSTR
jgi:HAD superfamily hydrolase (TIGR01509 family)